jgi:hypothetical protein
VWRARRRASDSPGVLALLDARTVHGDALDEWPVRFHATAIFTRD